MSMKPLPQASSAFDAPLTSNQLGREISKVRRAIRALTPALEEAGVRMGNLYELRKLSNPPKIVQEYLFLAQQLGELEMAKNGPVDYDR